MKIEIQSSTWKQLDGWWNYTEGTLLGRFGEQSSAISTNELSADWDTSDGWWDTYQASPLILPERKFAGLRGERVKNDAWTDVDNWWELYSEIGAETATEIAGILELSNELWAHSKVPFNEDPLSADITPSIFRRGPIHPRVEEDWSNWLAQLLSSSELLVSSSFDEEYTTSPKNVIREAHLPKEDRKFRRADILVTTDDRGVSIEVKIGDDDFEKTGETARLVEEEYSHLNWSHVLLLPKRQKEALAEKVEPELSEEDGQFRVLWDEPGPINVVFWQDVTSSIRTLLIDGEFVDDLWAANAYMFCSVMEQLVLRFQPKPTIDTIQNTERVGRSALSITMANQLEEQLTYLRDVVDS